MENNIGCLIRRTTSGRVPQDAGIYPNIKPFSLKRSILHLKFCNAIHWAGAFAASSAFCKGLRGGGGWAGRFLQVTQSFFTSRIPPGGGGIDYNASKETKKRTPFGAGQAGGDLRKFHFRIRLSFPYLCEIHFLLLYRNFFEKSSKNFFRQFCKCLFFECWFYM